MNSTFSNLCATILGLTLCLCNPVVAVGTLFEDDFSYGNNDGWTTTVGGWAVDTGHNAIQNIVGRAYTYAGDSNWEDYTFDVDITCGTGTTEFYVAVRVDPNSSPTSNDGIQYCLSVDGDNDAIRLRYTTATGITQVDQAKAFTLLDQTTYHISMAVVGSTITASIDGTPLYDYTFSGSDPIYTRGLIGIGYKSTDGPDGAWFDNVTVTEIPEPATMSLLLATGIGLLRRRRF
jgi:hypothetical protein